MANSVAIAVAVIFSLFVSPALSWSNVLPSGYKLKASGSLVHCHYHLVLQKDCDLVHYREGHGRIWHTNTTNKGVSCYLTVEPNGEVKLFGYQYDWAPPLWRSGVASGVGRNYALVLKYDGSLNVYGPAVWSNTPAIGAAAPKATGKPSSSDIVAYSTLWSGDVAPVGVAIARSDYKLELPRDCNLRLSNTKTGEIMWSAGVKDPVGSEDCYVNLEDNGELKVKSPGPGGVALWTSGASPYGSGEYVLALLPEGELAVYGPPIWSNVKGATGNILKAVEEEKKIAMVTGE